MDGKVFAEGVGGNLEVRQVNVFMAVDYPNLPESASQGVRVKTAARQVVELQGIEMVEAH
jgi:hypothetical protein